MLTFACSCNAQNSDSSIQLEYLGNTFDVQMDAFGYFYTYDTTDLSNNWYDNEYILIISNFDGTAFIKVDNQPDFTYLHAIKERPITSTSTVDTTTFTGHGYIIKINTRKIKGFNSNYDLYKGNLIIKYNKKRAVIKIKGAVHKPPQLID